MSDSKDIEVWAESVGLAPDALHILQEEGFTNLSQVRLLTPEVINEFFMKTKRLPLAQCLALHKAATQLRISSPESQATPNQLEQGECFDPESMSFPVPHQELVIGGPSQLTLHSECSANGNTVRLLMVGKTGGGKSSTANTILGDNFFSCDTRFDSVTDECSLKSSTRGGLTIEIMDSAGLFDTRKCHEEVTVDIARAVTCLHPGPHAILYVVRIGRFTKEDEDVFTRLMELFDKNLANYIILIFTGGDELERSVKNIDEILMKAPDNLRRILNACNNRYVVFNNMATDKQRQVELLLQYVHIIYVENCGVPYTCPKYFYISEAVEQEVKERMAKAEQKILKEERYVQELEARTRQAEEDVAREKEELHKREQERQLEMKAEDEKRRVELESLKQQLEKQQMNEEQRRQETEAFLRKLEEEREQQKREMEEERKKIGEILKDKEREMEDMMTNAMAEQKKLQEDKLRIREMEVNSLKESVAKNQGAGWIDFLTNIVDKFASAYSDKLSERQTDVDWNDDSVTRSLRPHHEESLGMSAMSELSPSTRQQSKDTNSTSEQNPFENNFMSESKKSDTASSFNPLRGIDGLSRSTSQKTSLFDERASLFNPLGKLSRSTSRKSSFSDDSTTFFNPLQGIDELSRSTSQKRSFFNDSGSLFKPFGRLSPPISRRGSLFDDRTSVFSPFGGLSRSTSQRSSFSDDGTSFFKPLGRPPWLTSQKSAEAFLFNPFGRLSLSPPRETGTLLNPFHSLGGLPRSINHPSDSSFNFP